MICRGYVGHAGAFKQAQAQTGDCPVDSSNRGAIRYAGAERKALAPIEPQIIQCNRLPPGRRRCQRVERWFRAMCNQSRRNLPPFPGQQIKCPVHKRFAASRDPGFIGNYPHQCLGGAALAAVLLVVGIGVPIGVQQLRYHEFLELGRVASRTLNQRRVIANGISVRRAADSLESCTSLPQSFL